MKTIGRNQAIAELRHELLKLVDAEHSLCLVAARRGIFCNGLMRWSKEELQERLGKLRPVDPGSERDEVEAQVEHHQLGLQALGEGRLPCDVDGGCRSLVCAGWDEFYESELAQFYREMCGEEVRVVPDALSEA